MSRVRAPDGVPNKPYPNTGIRLFFVNSNEFTDQGFVIIWDFCDNAGALCFCAGSDMAFNQGFNVAMAEKTSEDVYVFRPINIRKESK